MAAPTNWNCNNFGNSRNPCTGQTQFQQNQQFENLQGNHFSPRMPQQQTLQPFNPRFPPPGPGFVPNQSTRQSFSPGNTFVEMRLRNTSSQQLGHVYRGNLNSNDVADGSRYCSQIPAFFDTIPPPVGAGNEPHSQGRHSHLQHQPMNGEQRSMQNIQITNLQNDRNVIFQQNTSVIQNANVQKPTNFMTMEDRKAEDDQRWLQDWLQHRQSKTEYTLKKTPIKICEAQEKTRQMIVLLARLQKNKQILETVKHEDKSIWDQKLKEVLSIKNELESVQKELTSEENVRHLQAKVAQRKKKRERIKQNKKEQYELYEEEMANRERKHAEIDKAMQQLTEKQKLEKQEKDMQKEADEILSQVRKKLAEANKSIQVVNSLQKLRKLRTDRLERQGVLSMYESQGHGSTNRLMFEAKLSNMRELLNKQLDIYKAEEAALKVHLETEQEETREKEREKARLRMIERQKKERKKEEKILFGDQKDPVPGDPLYPFRQYYDAASQNLEALIAIRREWDGYLTRPELGSCIPDTWVVPVQPDSQVWASALENEQPT
ncbi:programmed cell death protein 7-like [Mercenaria mercenaria]|uniref:programmed cell death protein 7-like n=1 Tax=Mercenaria mercenaria TaxID=6596 RepID=UPI00234F1148|nr:programmed cell death protein 7-like [Mercenaria mercenaria]